MPKKRANRMSAESCGCDQEERWLCERHRKEIDNIFVESKTVRTFETGATRDQDTTKYDYEGFLSPLVLERYAAYMHKNRVQRDGTVRDSDNWQKGIPFDAYMKSGWRHFMEWWRLHRGPAPNHGDHYSDLLEDALCAILFNVSGYLHEYLKGQKR